MCNLVSCLGCSNPTKRFEGSYVSLIFNVETQIDSKLKI